MHQRGRGCRASSLPRWLDGWVFRIAGIEYDYYSHYDEPIMEDRSSASRQLPLRVHLRDAAAAAW